jgi:4'-phosphopantetheinyl transferase
MSTDPASTGATRWLARGEHEIPEHTAWLVPVEADRLAQLRFTKRRTEYLLRRWTAKQAIATALDMDEDVARDTTALSRIAVLNHMTGAPYALVDGKHVGVDISVTDRAGWAVCLVGPGLDAVGVDLELAEPRSDGFVRDYLTPPEQEYVWAQPDDDARFAAANLMWSAKESALKVLRTGLRADTRTVEVTLSQPASQDSSNAASDTGTLTRAEAGWGPLRVRHVPTGAVFHGWWRRDGEFVFTMCTTSPTPAPSALPASGDLATAQPVHSWLASPLAW